MERAQAGGPADSESGERHGPAKQRDGASRRLVAVLFLDLVGWTRLAERVDPEPLQLLLERYYEICCTAVEDHGGVVEKFIGDAVMAVFGAESSREDDALRALRTAFQIRADTGELHTPGATPLPVEIHCGIAAGEALVTRSARAGIRVVGDVVNLAARLQSAAGAGEIVVNEIVGHLAWRQFTMTPMPPVTVKGKAEPVPVLLAAGPAAAAPAADGTRLVDRGAERARLRAAYDRMTRDRRAKLVVVLGPPGIGKTRLVREVVDEFGSELTAVSGSCPSYGANGNHAALGQVLEALTRQVPACRSLVRTDGFLAAVLASLRPAPRSRKRAPGPGVEEVAWAARELLATAAVQPLVVVWDSLEWAGQTLLRLIGDLMDALRGYPVLMICVARPELADRDVGWVRGLPERDVVDVGALTPADSVELVTALAGAQAAEVYAHDLDLLNRVTIYSAGNPLFIKLMLESAPDGQPLDEVPATITAMVGAMLDRLPAPAQRVLGAASVIGQAFTLEQLAILGERDPAAGLVALTARRIVRRTAADGGYRFAQQPVHAVAYGRLKKEQRFAWHRCLAERGVGAGFHYEAAVRLLTDLRPDDADLPRLSGRAARELVREGMAALRQRDVPTAIDLQDRALRLARGAADRWPALAEIRAVAAIRLSDALMLAGDTHRAIDVVSDAALGRACLVQRCLLAVRLGRVGEVDNLAGELDGVPDDHLAWCRFEQLRMLVHLGSGRFAAAERAARAALGRARAIGDVYEEDRLLAALCEVRQWSPTPMARKLAGCARLAKRFAADRYLLVPVLTAQARCLAYTGDAAGARAALTQARATVELLRLDMGRVLIDQAAGLVCSLDGAYAEAERYYRAAADAVERVGHAPAALTLRVMAVRERARRRPDRGAAAQLAALLERSDEMDMRGRLLGLAAAVRLAALAAQGVPSDGSAVLALLSETDDPCLRGEVYFDLAQAHRHLGHDADAAVLAAAAIESYGSVGATEPERAVRAWM